MSRHVGLLAEDLDEGYSDSVKADSDSLRRTLIAETVLPLVLGKVALCILILLNFFRV